MHAWLYSRLKRDMTFKLGNGQTNMSDCATAGIAIYLLAVMQSGGVIIIINIIITSSDDIQPSTVITNQSQAN